VVYASGDYLTLTFITHCQYSTNVGMRLYLYQLRAEICLLEGKEAYQRFKQICKEFTFTVDVSNLPCGVNGALCLLRMGVNGGTSRYADGNAGARYGIGY
jgi:cellulose 1,4-beta-cellobiosidase